MKVKFSSFIHPQWHLIFGYYIAISPTYILSQIEFKAKGYGLKHSIANLINQPSCILYAITVLDYTN